MDIIGINEIGFISLIWAKEINILNTHSYILSDSDR